MSAPLAYEPPFALGRDRHARKGPRAARRPDRVAHRVLHLRLRSQRGRTKTGNGHVRRLLVEAAWHHRQPYHASSPVMRRRWDLAGPAPRARGHAGNQRLHDRWQRFKERGERSVVANAAIARELAGWCWSLAVLDL